MTTIDRTSQQMTTRPMRRGNQRQLVLWVALSASLLAVELLLVWLLFRDQNAQVQQDTEDAARAVATDVQRALTDDAQDLQALVWQEQDSARWHTVAAAFLSSHKRILRIERRDADKVLVDAIDSPYSSALFDFIKRVLLQKETLEACAEAAAPGLPVYSRSYFVPIGRGLGVEVMDLCVAERTAGRPSGYVVATIGLSKLLEASMPGGISKAYEASFIQGDGTRLARAGEGRGTRRFRAERLLSVPGLSLQLRLESTSESHQLKVNMATVLGAMLTFAIVAISLLLVRGIRKDAELVKEMQETVHAKGEFLASISHELRSPLQSIRSAVDLLELRTVGADQAALINRLQRATDALSAHLRDLLTLAQGEARKLELQPEPFEATELVREIVGEHMDAAAAKGLVLQVNVPKTPMYVVADATRIGQILTNLVSNAVKYTTAGEVCVSLAPFDSAKGRLRFEVRDTGPGIDADILPTLFAPFERFGALDRTRESVGIGLAIVQTLVDNLGGTIRVATDAGNGTAFIVKIPASELVEDVDDEAGRVGSVRLLIVDDRSDVLESLAAVALVLGYEADIANSAAVAANKLAAKEFDLVLVDVNMPVKSGPQFASETRRGNGPNRETPMIAMSAAADPQVGQAWPFSGFVAKPIDRRALKRVIEASLRSKRTPTTKHERASGTAEPV